MKVALLGVGRIGPLHAATLSKLPAVDEVLIADIVTQRAQAVAADVGARAMASVESALDEADAVVIATPTGSHLDLIRAAISRRLPTFCEKPLAQDLDRSIEVRREVEVSGIAFQLGFQRRFDPAYVEARRLIVEDELGAIYMLDMQSHDPAPASEEFIAGSGGMFRDLSIHDLDVLRYLTGSEVAEVFAQGSVREFPVYGKYDDVETAVATLRMDDGVLVLLGAARHDPSGHDVRTEIFGSRDSISVGLGPRTPIRSVEPGVPPPAGPAWEIFLDRWDIAYRDEMAAFVRMAANGSPSPCTADDGVEALRIAEALTLAVRDHRIVALTEIAT
ncbi:MAG: Gfo/Idh/MocA family oxidoreductase [Chloroflexota bacterium]